MRYDSSSLRFDSYQTRQPPPQSSYSLSYTEGPPTVDSGHSFSDSPFETYQSQLDSSYRLPNVNENSWKNDHWRVWRIFLLLLKIYYQYYDYYSLSPTHLLNNLVYINTHRMETICLMMIWIILCSLLFFHISFDIMYYLLYAWFFILFVYFSLFVCTSDHPKDSLDSRPKDFLFLYWKNSNSEFISLQNPFLAFVLKSFSYN